MHQGRAGHAASSATTHAESQMFNVYAYILAAPVLEVPGPDFEGRRPYTLSSEVQNPTKDGLFATTTFSFPMS